LQLVCRPDTISTDAGTAAGLACAGGGEGQLSLGLGWGGMEGHLSHEAATVGELGVYSLEFWGWYPKNNKQKQFSEWKSL